MLFIGILSIIIGLYFVFSMIRGLNSNSNDIKEYYIFGITLGFFFIVVGIFSILNYFIY